MYTDVETFLAEMSEEFLTGDVDAVLKRMSLPTAIYFGQDAIIVHGRKELAEVTEAYLEGLRLSGHTKTQPVVDALSIPNKGRMTALTTARILDVNGLCIGLSKAKYFLRTTEDGLKIELVEHSQVPLGSGDANDALQSLAI